MTTDKIELLFINPPAKITDNKSMAQKKNSRNSKKKNKNTLFATACVLLGLLVIFIIFLVKKDQIKTNLKETAFFEKVVGTTPQFIENHEVEKKENDEVPLKEDVTIRIESVQPVAPKAEEDDFITMPEETSSASEVKPAEDKKIEKTEPKKENPKKEEEKKPEAKKSATSELELCFVLIDGDGSVLRKPIKRSVPKSDSPLTTSINLLLKGPDTTKSAERNCMTLIPEGTRLISAKVQGGVAYLNFTEEFLFNGFGIDGQIHQLEQIVYTATAFPTVSSVQFMIEGKKQDYLSEGVWIGSPLSRASF